MSVGLSEDVELLDLDYSEDKDADVDCNLVMTGAGDFIEIQGSGEEATFSRAQLDRMLKIGKLGIDAITAQQKRRWDQIGLWTRKFNFVKERAPESPSVRTRLSQSTM